MSRLREVHIADDITIRLNDEQLEAKGPAGAWTPITISVIRRVNRRALADLLAQPFEEPAKASDQELQLARREGFQKCFQLASWDRKPSGWSFCVTSDVGRLSGNIHEILERMYPLVEAVR